MDNVSTSSVSSLLTDEELEAVTGGELFFVPQDPCTVRLDFWWASAPFPGSVAE
jgi:hypothetical protein